MVIDYKEKSKDICRFMGHEVSGDTVIIGSGQRLNISEFRYLHDWGELMPVVDKINERDYVTIIDAECKIHSLNINEFEDIRYVTENTKEAVFLAVADYCTWAVNQNKVNKIDIGYDLETDINKRVEWISKRSMLNTQQSQYVAFQMREAVIHALTNKTNG